MKTICIIILTLVMMCPATNAQQVTRKYISDTAVELGFDFIDLRPSFRKRMDFDGDGKPELGMIQDDDEGYSTGLRILDTGTREIVYSINQEELEQHFGKGRLLLMAINELGEDDRGLILLKLNPELNSAGKAEFPSLSTTKINGLVCDTLLFWSFKNRSLIGSLPPKITGGFGNTDGSIIEHLGTFAYTDLDGDKRFDIVAQDSASKIVEVWGFDNPSGVGTKDHIAQSLTQLMQSYPNPFRNQTVIEYEMDSSGQITIKLFDILGREIQTIIQGDQPAGKHRAHWNGLDASGVPVAAGTYFYQLHVDGELIATKQLVLIR